MATTREYNGSFRLLFCHGERRRNITADRVTRSQAEAHAENVDELLAVLAGGTLALPGCVDLSTFTLRKGRPRAEARARVR